MFGVRGDGLIDGLDEIGVGGDEVAGEGIGKGGEHVAGGHDFVVDLYVLVISFMKGRQG